MLYGINTNMGCGARFHAFQSSLQPPLRFYGYNSTFPPPQTWTLWPRCYQSHSQLVASHRTWLLGTAVNTNRLMTSGTEFAHLKEKSLSRCGKGARERGDPAIAMGNEGTQLSRWGMRGPSYRNGERADPAALSPRLPGGLSPFRLPSPALKGYLTNCKVKAVWAINKIQNMWRGGRGGIKGLE